MYEMDTDHDLNQTVRRLVALSRETSADPAHKAELRRQLLARHHELAANGRCGRSAPWTRMSRVKRVGLTLPPLCAALAASIVLLVVPVLSGHQTLQAAEAQRLSPKLMYNVPTITSWQWT